MAPPVVGLTGGIASGKSTVASAFEQLGAKLVDADVLARDVVEPGQPALADIVAQFGEQVLDAEGRLDRKALGARVFGDEQARRSLNAITHPRIAMAAKQALLALADSGAPYILYEAALLVESGAYRNMDAIIVVALDAKLQLARLQARDGTHAEEASARINSQSPLATKLVVADYVIENHGDLEDLHRQVESVHRALLTRFGEDRL